MAGDTRGSDTVHTRYARKGTPMAMNSGKLYAGVARRGAHAPATAASASTSPSSSLLLLPSPPRIYGSPAGYRGRGQTNGGPNGVSCEIVTRSRAHPHMPARCKNACVNTTEQHVGFQGCAVNHPDLEARGAARWLEPSICSWAPLRIGAAVSNSNLNL
jgi:hypothetical protein